MNPFNSLPFRPGPYGLQQPKSNNNNAKFVPSRSLRENITERLEMQQECLDQIHERLGEFLKLGEEGKANSSGNSPGDEQIDGEKIAQTKQQAILIGDPWSSAARSRISRGPRFQPWTFPQQQPQTDTQEEALDEDPLEKYLRLENEIRLLANMGTVPSKHSNPYQTQADQYENMTKPHKALAKRLPEILGP